MPWNGSGVFNRIYSWVSDAVGGIDINATRMDTDTDDIVTGLENCRTLDGQTIPTANLPMNGFRHTAVGDGSAANHYASVGQIQKNGVLFAAAGGAADAITAAFTPATTALTDGEQVCVRASAANATTAPTFAPDGLTAHTITRFGGAALVAGDIVANQELTLRYNASNTRWELINPHNPSLRDTSAAFDVTQVATSSVTLTANRTITWDVANGSRTLKLTGNATLNQDVSTTGTPTFAVVSSSGPGAGFNGLANGSSVTIVTSPLTGACFDVTVWQATSSAVWATGKFVDDGATITQVGGSNSGGTLTLTISGANIQAHNGTGGTINVDWAYIRSR